MNLEPIRINEVGTPYEIATRRKGARSARELIFRSHLRTRPAIDFAFRLEPIIELMAGPEPTLFGYLMRAFRNAGVPAFFIQLSSLKIRVHNIRQQRFR
jgi:hypothetical protein